MLSLHRRHNKNYWLMRLPTAAHRLTGRPGSKNYDHTMSNGNFKLSVADPNKIPRCSLLCCAKSVHSLIWFSRERETGIWQQRK